MGLRKLRKKERYSIQQVAEILNVKPDTIYRIEQGKQEPTIEQIKGMSKLYKVSISTIVNAYGEQDND